MLHISVNSLGGPINFNRHHTPTATSDRCKAFVEPLARWLSNNDVRGSLSRRAAQRQRIDALVIRSALDNSSHNALPGTRELPLQMATR